MAAAAMLKVTTNPLLARDDVGKSKPTCYNLPDEHFAYGRPDNPDFEGAREVTMQWVSHTPRPRIEEQVQDFRKINKMSVAEKAVTARAVAKHRKTIDVPLTAREGQAPPPKVIPSDVVPAFTYGKKTRPSTPIASVVSYQFASEYESDITTKYDFLGQEKEKAAQVRKIRSTKAAKGHTDGATKKLGGPAETQQEIFKLPKFKKIGPRVDFPGGKSAELKKLSDDPPVTPSSIARGEPCEE